MFYYLALAVDDGRAGLNVLLLGDHRTPA
eukprot:COSAG03_NODE_9296_length_731_cov_1.131329_2_plen_28_part_01